MLFRAGSTASSTAAATSAKARPPKLLAQLEREVAPSYLAAQRWFAGKGQGTPTVTITDIGRWQPKQQPWLLTVAAAQFPADTAQEYFLPLALEWGAERAGPHAAHALARVRQRAATGTRVRRVRRRRLRARAARGA